MKQARPLLDRARRALEAHEIQDGGTYRDNTEALLNVGFMELVDDLPPEPEARLSRAERALRLVGAELDTGASGEMARLRYQDLLDRLHRVRFAGAPPENCIEEIRSFIDDNGKGVA